MVGAPYTGYLTLAFLAAVIVLMAFDSPVGTWTVASIIVIVPALMIGWYASRGRIRDIAAARDAADARAEQARFAEFSVAGTGDAD
ncbi:hypothetical protein [Arthrobacter sp. AQ5-05]|uniref:hypothetical protein n=1 Tax=Arthrobacter sp. AQ5-05 TaxID=2184581 RepID=UPI0026AECCDC